MLQLRPDIVKLDRTLVRGLHTVAGRITGNPRRGRHRTSLMRPLMLPLVLGAVLALAGCGADGDTVLPQGTPALVDMVDIEFRPETVTVPAGTRVVWEQRDAARHTVTFEDGADSGPLSTGERYERTFEDAGSYPYVCDFHPLMTGEVEVE